MGCEMGKTKVVLDTNILISSFGWSGKPRIIFEKCLNEELDLVTSPNQIGELKRVIGYPKFQFTEKQKAMFISIILDIATVVEIPGQVHVIADDPDDDLILETAIVGKVDYLISGDPHLLKVGEFMNVKIITANEFLRRDKKS